MVNNIVRRLILVFFALLPWSVIVSVTGSEKLGIDIFRYWKEIFIIVFFCVYVWDILRKKEKFRFDIIDILIVLFGFSLVGVSLWRGVSLGGYVYGLRYELEFFVLFMLLRRMMPLYGLTIYDFCRVFLISGGSMLFLAILIRYIFGEEILTVFGFSSNITQFSGGGGWPPKIYYLVQGEGVIRFQGLLEGPNQMGYFLLVYIGALWYFFQKQYSYKFLINCIGGILIYLLFVTYSRSALVGAFGASIFLLIFSFFRKKNFSKESFLRLLKKISLPLIFVGLIVVLFAGNMHILFIKKGSTNAHFERMVIGLERFLSAPMGVGLGEAGPASRSVHEVTNERLYTTELPRVKNVVADLKVRNDQFNFTSEYFYIPESWYIQQLIQGGIITFLLYVVLMFVFFIRLLANQPLLWTFLAVLAMNLFLHAFESMHASLLLFSFLGSYLPVENHKKLGKNS